MIWEAKLLDILGTICHDLTGFIQFKQGENGEIFRRLYTSYLCVSLCFVESMTHAKLILYEWKLNPEQGLSPSSRLISVYWPALAINLKNISRNLQQVL